MQIQSKNEPNRLTTIRHPFQAKDREPMAHLREAAAPAKGHLGPKIGTFAASEMALENLGAFLYQSLR